MTSPVVSTQPLAMTASSRLIWLGRGSRVVQGATRVLPLAIALAFFGVANSTFLTVFNLDLIANSAAFVGIVCVAQTILIIGGEFDLSVGGVAGLCGYESSRLMTSGHWSIAAALAAGLALGAAFGMVNGLVTTRARIPSFIVTIGTLDIANGVTTYLSNGNDTPALPGPVSAFGLRSVGQLSVFVFVLIAVVLLAEIFLRSTTAGRRVFATGANADAARIIGIRTTTVKLRVFVLVGLLAAAAGILQCMNLGFGDPTVGTGWELTSVAAVVIGGTSLFGGAGSAVGTLLGIVVLQVIANGVVALGINTNWQTVVTGLLMIILVAMDLVRRRVFARLLRHG